MTIEQNAARFAAWLDQRFEDADVFAAEELLAVRETFYRLILAELSPVQQAFFLSSRNAKRESVAIKL